MAAGEDCSAPQSDRQCAASEWRGIVTGGVAEGARDCTIAKLTGHLLRRRVDPIVVLELMQVWNATRCTPPLPATTSCGWSIRLPARSCAGEKAMDDENILRLVMQQEQRAEWLARCLKSDTGKPLAILANALIALRAEMNGAFTYDQMLCAPILLRADGRGARV